MVANMVTVLEVENRKQTVVFCNKVHFLPYKYTSKQDNITLNWCHLNCVSSLGQLLQQLNGTHVSLGLFYWSEFWTYYIVFDMHWAGHFTDKK